MKGIFKTVLLIAALSIFATSCGEHFIADKDYRKQVEKDFKAKTEALDCPEAFSIFRTPLTTEEREALMFLYAYMPVGDILNHDGEYFLENYRLTQEALAAMPWGSTIPEREIRHFVLPIRVNNENLDTARTVFFNELKDRVKEIYFFALKVEFLYCFISCSICNIFPRTAIGLFTSDPEMLAYATPYMKFFITGFTIFGLQSCSQNTFVGLGQAGKSLFLAIFRKLILLIPLVYILSSTSLGVTGVFLAESISDATSALTTFTIFMTTLPGILRRGAPRP